MFIWSVVALAGVSAELPPEGHAVWVEAEPDCPWSRVWLDALLTLPDRQATVIVASRAEPDRWAAVAETRAWPDLIVVDRDAHADRFPSDGRLVTTALYESWGRRLAWTPTRLDGPIATQTLAFAVDPTTALKMPKQPSLVELVLYARTDASPRLVRRIGRYLRRPTDPTTAYAALDVAEILAQSDRAGDLTLAAKLTESARAYVDAPPEPAPRAELSADELIADVRQLGALVRDRYSGWIELEERLGLSWEDHVAQTVAALEARPYPWHEAVAMLTDNLLGEVRDAHFHVRGETPDGKRWDRWLVPDATPWFTALRTDISGTAVAGPDALLGTVLAVPVVPDPHEAQLGTAYRFPTVLPDGAPGFLIGTFAPDDPETLEVAGEPLPTHGVPLLDETLTFRVDAGGLAVRTMTESRLEGLADTATELATRPAFVLDLRGNLGGSDRPALDWVQRFSGGSYRLPNLTHVLPEGFYASDDGPLISDEETYDGHVDVLLDKNVCSSGETFTMLAAQLPDVRLVGTNTLGCLAHGNVRPQGTLVHTGLALSFGTSAFYGEPVPAAEGFGVFPDVWIDAPPGEVLDPLQ